MKKIYVLLLFFVSAKIYSMDEECLALLASLDAYVYLSRGEGFSIQDDMRGPLLGNRNFQSEQQNDQSTNSNDEFKLKPLVFSLQAQTLAYIAQSSSTPEELKQAMPEAFSQKVVLLRKAIEILSKQNCLGDDIGKPLAKDLLIVQALLSCIKHIKQERLVNDIMGNAACVGALETISFFYNNGVPLTITSHYSRDTIFHSLAYGSKNEEDSQIKLAQFLLDNGVNIDIEGESKDRPLEIAVRHNKLALARYLLCNRANVNAKDITGRTVLYSALLNPQRKDPSIIKLLLEYGATIPKTITNSKIPILEHLQEKLLNNLLHKVAVQEIIDLIKEYQNKEQGQATLSDQSTKENQFLTAASVGNTETLKRLFGERVNVFCVDNSGNNALMLAAQTGRFEVVKFLIEQVKNNSWVTQTNNNGQTAADLAESIGDMRLVRFIKKTCNNCGKTGCTARCGKCHNVYYCGIGCQNADWATHKPNC